MLDYSVVGIIVVLSFCHPQLSESSVLSANEETIQDRNIVIRRVTANVNSTSVRCPDLQDDENITVTLYKTAVLHSTFFSRIKPRNESSEKERFQVSVNNNTVRYLIGWPRANDTGLYSCNVLTGPDNRTSRTNTFLFVKGIVLLHTFNGQQKYNECIFVKVALVYTIIWLLLPRSSSTGRKASDKHGPGSMLRAAGFVQPYCHNCHGLFCLETQMCGDT
ncbi:uncharacterized protein LOC113578528 isoform X1 [Electrophorus electricus]|uniref:uncharacterized protein LOC113578528 isoform X1 n=1 Tax=Electrophorus electricus TaxID=8005 RepID=UPI0015CFC6E6|nr:uncharacterized protein LOC113578528 isoform X1 [Electrophorus electricus]